MKNLIDYLILKPHHGSLFALATSGGSYLLWLTKLAPLVSFLGAVVGLLVGLLTLFLTIRKVYFTLKNGSDIPKP